MNCHHGSERAGIEHQLHRHRPDGDLPHHHMSTPQRNGGQAAGQGLADLISGINERRFRAAVGSLHRAVLQERFPPTSGTSWLVRSAETKEIRDLVAQGAQIHLTTWAVTERGSRTIAWLLAIAGWHQIDDQVMDWSRRFIRPPGQAAHPTQTGAVGMPQHLQESAESRHSWPSTLA